MNTCSACILLKPHRASFVTSASRRLAVPSTSCGNQRAWPFTPLQQKDTSTFWSQWTCLLDMYGPALLINQLQDTVCKCINSIFVEYGTPCELVTDPASIFRRMQLRQLLKALGVSHYLSIPPSHAGTGVAERYIGLTRLALAIPNLQNKQCWSLNVSAAQTMLNNRVSETTGLTPYQLFFHRPYFYLYPPLIGDQATSTNDTNTDT